MTFTPSERNKAIDKALRDAEIEAALAAKAREDPIAFCKFTLRSEKTRERITLLDGHYRLLEWLQKTTRGVVMASPRLGKTTIVTYGLLPWMIGRNHKRFAALLWSSLKGNAEDHLRSIRDRIHTSRELRMVFPCFAKPLIEDNAESILLDREEFSYIKPPTIQVVSPNPKKQGFHYDCQLADDAMTPELAQSPYLCEQQAEMIMSYDSRRTSELAPRWYIQNCFRRWDVGQILVDKYGWDLFLMPAVDEHGKTLYHFVYSQSAVDNYPPSQKDADLKCIPRKEGDSLFSEFGIEKARILGLGTSLVPEVAVEDIPDGAFIIHGVDPTGGRTPGTPATVKGGDDAAIVTTLFAPPGMWLDDTMPNYLTLPLPMEDSRQWLRSLPGDAMVGRILWITTGKFGLPEMVDHIIDLKERYGPAAFIVETNGVQVWLKQALNLVDPELMVVPFRTGANKHHEAFGVGALTNDFEAGMWILPTQRSHTGALQSEPAVEKLIGNMRNVVQGEHIPDAVIGLWLARHGARIYGPFQHAVGEIGVGGGKSYFAPQPLPAFGAIPGLGRFLEARAESRGIPLLPTTKDTKNVDEATKRRFGL